MDVVEGKRMETFLKSSPIQRQLFKDVGDIERRANSCVISFIEPRRPRRLGRFWVVTVVIMGALLLLSLSGLAGVESL